MQKRIYVWEMPVRLTHWLLVLCIAVLSLTGFYIGRPFLLAVSDNQYVMGWMRFLHFSSAYIFVFTIIVRIYWSFVGNKYADWRVFFPYAGKRRKDLGEVIKYYALIRTKPPHEAGHTALAGIAYFVIFLVCIFSVFTGFALFSLHNPGGFMSKGFGWMFSLFSISQMRLYHHLVLWVIICFTILHLYNAVLLNSVEKSGILGSIFDGYKLVETDKQK